MTESDLVILGACQEIMESSPQACLLTLHDCLVGTEDHVHAHKDTLGRWFWDRFKVKPVMKVGPFGDP